MSARVAALLLALLALVAFAAWYLGAGFLLPPAGALLMVTVLGGRSQSRRAQARVRGDQGRERRG